MQHFLFICSHAYIYTQIPQIPDLFWVVKIKNEALAVYTLILKYRMGECGMWGQEGGEGTR